MTNSPMTDRPTTDRPTTDRPMTEAAYRADVEGWRAARDARLRAPDGWLSLVGLVWLKPGVNRFGSARDADVRLPDSVAAHAGAFVVHGRAIALVVEPGAALTLGGRPAKAGPFRTDAAPGPDVLQSGTVTWQVIERGERLGVRIRDRASLAQRAFRGTRWFAVDPAYRVVARFVPRAGAAEMVVPDASGGHQTLKSPGTLELTLLGKPQRLDPVLDGDDDDDQLIVFRDLTSGRETYGGGRFVRARRQADGTFVVDFNRAYAPPCAFTPYATCPLPPAQNRLPIAVRAGEKSADETSHDGSGPATGDTPEGQNPHR
ncbi:MAG TPA: DUF1684 domain-containing protein [Polyangia bacterium]|jgi:hypothetical protein|nr:DUF1684 domain-containing protein [Polyangia bacterium]